MIEMKEVTLHFPQMQKGVYAVRHVNLSIQPGEIFGIIGRSGAGKSSLVRMLNLLNRPSAGHIIIDGQDLTQLSPNALRQARRRIGMIFQHFNLLSSRTVYQNVAFPLELAGVSQLKIEKTVMPLLEMVGLVEMKDRYVVHISGGQKQRVAIARALANQPSLLLSDEATSALDPETTRSILDLLCEINQKLKLTILLITHEMEVIKTICHRMAVMEKGEIVEVGNVLDIFRAPHHDVTRALIGDTIGCGLPSGILQCLQARLSNGAREHNGHLYRLTFIGADVERPLLSEVSRKFNVDLSILHGQMDEIQGKPFGSLAILANGRHGQLREAIIWLRAQDVMVEELNYVI